MIGAFISTLHAVALAANLQQHAAVLSVTPSLSCCYSIRKHTCRRWRQLSTLPCRAHCQMPAAAATAAAAGAVGCQQQHTAGFHTPAANTARMQLLDHRTAVEYLYQLLQRQLTASSSTQQAFAHLQQTQQECSCLATGRWSKL
jgi:hypothetical protein